MNFDWDLKADIQPLHVPLAKDLGVEIAVLREDVVHPVISGNKYRKLRYFIEEAKEKGLGLLTFGGPHSNHIHALAQAGSYFDIETMAYVRGEEWAMKTDQSSTLSFALAQNMELNYLDRSMYRKRNNEDFLEYIAAQHPDYLVVPEGGRHVFGYTASQKILGPHTRDYKYVSVAMGTGTTAAGVVSSLENHQTALLYAATKESREQVEVLTQFGAWGNYLVFSDLEFGGFAKIKPALVEFINDFKKEHKIALDPIYNAKHFYGIFEALKNGFFRSGDRVLMIHTGGMQGVPATNTFLASKKWPMII